MAIWFNWRPLSPLIEGYVDDGTRDLCTADFSIEDVGDFQVALVGTKHRVELVRVATLGSDGNLSEKQQRAIGRLFDHTLAVLRLTHDASIDLLRWGHNTISLGAHGIDGKPRLNIEISEVPGYQREIAADNIRGVLLASMGHRHIIKLLADAETPTLPLQYRYLSLYKILELEFRVSGEWIGLLKALEPYEIDYRAQAISARSLPNLIHEVRDKCAHIKTGGADTLGLIGLDGADVRIVEALVKLLIRLVTDHMNSKSIGLRFTPGSSEPPQRQVQSGSGMSGRCT